MKKFISYLSIMPFLHTFYRQFILVCGLVLVCITSSAQKNDYIWLSGYDSQVGYSSNFGFYFGTTVLDFNSSPRQVYYDSLKMNFDKTNTSFCDSDGNLMFYTNGVYIANSLDERIENSDSLNDGYVQHVVYPRIEQYGYRNSQGIAVFPSIKTSDLYYILHTWMDTAGGTIRCKKLLCTTLNMSANGGHGKVLTKNVTVLRDSIGQEVTATKHANGRDWWLLAQKCNTDLYYRILLDSTGPHVLQGLTGGGGQIWLNDLTASCFSPDGTKFAYTSIFSGLNVFDFNRCTGELSNGINIRLPTLVTNGAGWGVAISPNSRFLYASYKAAMFQFDLWATNIAASIDTVGIFDGTDAPFAAYFHTQQLGPDGKIYISCGSGDTVYHIIEQPDEKGDLCLFKQHNISLPSPSGGVPNFPNYRLGALTGSACDTLTALTPTLSQRERELKVFPNPAANVVTVDYGYINWEKGDVDLEITNAIGQLVYTQHLPMYSGFQRLDVTQYAGGVYNVAIKRGNSVVATSQFVKN